MCYLFPSTTQVKALWFLRASPIIVRVGIRLHAFLCFLNNNNSFAPNVMIYSLWNVLQWVLLLRLLILQGFGLPLSLLCGYFSWLPNEVVTHQHNWHSINSNSTKTNNKNKNKTTIITTLLILPLLLRINNNTKCWRLNHERSNTFTLKLKLILPVPVWKSHS